MKAIVFSMLSVYVCCVLGAPRLRLEVTWSPRPPSLWYIKDTDKRTVTWKCAIRKEGGGDVNSTGASINSVGQNPRRFRYESQQWDRYDVKNKAIVTAKYSASGDAPFDNGVVITMRVSANGCQDGTSSDGNYCESYRLSGTYPEGSN